MKLLLLYILGALVVACMSSCIAAYDFYVGGKAGWGPNPREPYNSWASRKRFQVDDRIIFKYEKGIDSVLVVDKAAYDACNAAGPIKSYTDGHSVFKFDRSGPFYFISGASCHCGGGQQKLNVVVLAIRNQTRPGAPPPSPRPPPPPPTPSKVPSSSPPAPSPPSPTGSGSSPPSAADQPAQSPLPSPSSSPLRVVVNVGLVVQASLVAVALLVYY